MTDDSADAINGEGNMNFKIVFKLHKPMEHKNKMLIICWIILTLIIFLIMLLFDIYGNGSWWEDMDFLGNNRLIADYGWCEKNVWKNFWRQRANTWSNLGIIVPGYFFVFIYVFIKLNYGRRGNIDININDSDCVNNVNNVIRKHTISLMINYPIWVLMYGLSLMYVGLTSGSYHATYKTYPQRMDLTAIYSIMLYFVFYEILKFKYARGIESIAKIRNSCKSNNDNDIDIDNDDNDDNDDNTTSDDINNFNMSYNYKMNRFSNILCVVLNVLNIGIAIWRVVLNTYIAMMEIYVIVIGLIVFFAEYYWIIHFGIGLAHLQNAKTGKRCIKIGVAGLVILFVAFGFRQAGDTDITNYFCDPQSFWQLHAVFHALLGVALFVIFWAYFGQFSNRDVNNVVGTGAINVVNQVQMSIQIVQNHDQP